MSKVIDIASRYNKDVLDWLMVERCVKRVLINKLEGINLRIALYILDRALPWRKLAAQIKVTEFISGLPRMNSIGLSSTSQTAVYRSLENLEKRGYIIRQKDTHNNNHIMVNYIPLLAYYASLVPMDGNRIDIAMEIISEEMDILSIEEVDIPEMRLSDSLAAAKKVAAGMHKKKSKKQKIVGSEENTRKTMSVSDLEHLIETIIDHTGCQIRRPATQKELVIQRVTMKKLIKESTDKHIDLEFMLNIAIDKSLALGAYLEQVDERYTHNYGVFDFTDFYYFRNYIYDWCLYVDSQLKDGQTIGVDDVRVIDVLQYLKSSLLPIRGEYTKLQEDLFEKYNFSME